MEGKPQSRPNERTGIAWALAAIVLWGTLAACVGDTLDDLAASTVVFWCLLFAAPTLVAFDVAMRRPVARSFLAPPRIVLLGVWGIFGYHAFLFEALDRAPMVEANLLNYLWPLLIVLLSPVVVRERVSPLVLVGALAGFAGAALVVTQGKGVAVEARHAPGYVLALLAAVTWSTFSLFLKRSGDAGKDRMALFAVWSLGAALVFAAATGGLIVPERRELLVIAWTGVGPMAIAFICWERAMTQADAATIGAISYLDPLLSTLAIAWVRSLPITTASWGGMGLIVAGAALAPLLSRVKKAPAPAQGT